MSDLNRMSQRGERPYRFHIDDQSDPVLQQHVLGDARHGLLHQHQVGPHVHNALDIVLQELALLVETQQICHLLQSHSLKLEHFETQTHSLKLDKNPRHLISYNSILISILHSYTVFSKHLKKIMTEKNH